MKKLVRLMLISFVLSYTGLAIAGPVNVNTADAATIAMELKGVGNVVADRIVAYREEHGPFKSLEDLKQVKGIGDKIIANNEADILFSE